MKYLLLILLLTSPVLADWSISNRLPFEESWRDPAASFVNDYYFQVYEEFECRPYLRFMIEHWLAYNPIRKSQTATRWIRHDPPVKWWGYVLIQDRECYEVADVTGDGATDMLDFAKYARHYRPTDVGLIRWPAKKVAAVEPCKSELEILAELWMLIDDGPK